LQESFSEELHPPASADQYANDATLAELQIAIDNSMTGISWLDTEGIFRQVRDGYARMLGYKPEELVGQSWAITVPESDQPTGIAAVHRMLDEGRCEVETRALRKDGSIFYKRLLLVKTTDSQGRHNGHYCFMSDISERQENQRRIADSERLKTIGTLAGGIAHDLNNLLTPILGYAELLAYEASYPDNNVAAIHDAAVRAQELIGHLLQLSKQESDDMVPLRVDNAVRMAQQFVTGSLPPNVSIKTELMATQDTVLGQQSALELLVMNLAANAGHAMRDTGGTLTIRLTNPNSEEIMLEVSDTGSGMSPEVAERIFDPFFTTKSPTEGTGLGLLMVKEAVESMNGTIEVDSEIGHGSRFLIRIPLYQNNVPSNTQAPESSPLAVYNILLIDDDQAVLEVSKSMLSSLGHHVTSYADPEEALAEDLGNFDLLITDYHIGGTSGVELVQRLQGFSGPVIMISGHFDGNGAFPEQVAVCLNKPFKIADLSAAIEQALES